MLPGRPELLDLAAMLADLGYGEAAVTDVCDLPLREAVRRFQADEGLISTGGLDDTTVAAIVDADARRRREELSTSR